MDLTALEQPRQVLKNDILSSLECLPSAMKRSATAWTVTEPHLRQVQGVFVLLML